jgi:hypothetical protein
MIHAGSLTSSAIALKLLCGGDLLHLSQIFWCIAGANFTLRLQVDMGFQLIAVLDQIFQVFNEVGEKVCLIYL